MINQDDLEAFGYYNIPPTTDNSDATFLEDYCKFVEGMVLTYGRDRLAENTLGLVGEAGEVAEKVKKFFRDGTLDEAAIQLELGDVTFYLAALHNVLGLDFSETIQRNKDKLIKRKMNNTLRGSGDNR